MYRNIEELVGAFSVDRTILLTPEDERLIIEHLTPNDYIANGSSRVVYELNVGEHNYVAKVAMSHGGVNQNQVEYDFYRYNRGPFAILFAHGKVVNIMEVVENCQFVDQDDFYWDDEYEEECGDMGPWLEVIEILNEITGYDGGDNGQLGISSITGEIVAYDYGYCYDFPRDELVDSVGWWMDGRCPLANALDIIDTGVITDAELLNELANEEHDKQRGRCLRQSRE